MKAKAGKSTIIGLASVCGIEAKYDVCVRTSLGGCMQFCVLERQIVAKENAVMVAKQYADLWHKSNNFKSIVVREKGGVIKEFELS